VSETVVLSVMVGDVGFENSEGMGEAPDSVMVSDVLAALSTRTWNASVGPLLMFRRAAYTKTWAGEERLTSTWVFIRYRGGLNRGGSSNVDRLVRGTHSQGSR
jgi:hypothetical protein